MDLTVGFGGSTGDYALGGGCGGGGDLNIFYSVTTGAFAFEANVGTTNIVVTNGIFSLTHVVISP
jgi:hypothetical protein